MDSTPERWLPMIGWEGYYEVSDRGRVRSVDRIMMRSNGSPFTIRSTIIKPNRVRKRTEHIQVHLYRGGRETREVVLVHRAVLEAFDGPCPPGQECCHNDGDATNNHVDNLRWDTHKANGEDAVRHRTHCHNGHQYTPENTFFESNGQRRCRKCYRAKERRRSERQSMMRNP